MGQGGGPERGCSGERETQWSFCCKAFETTIHTGASSSLSGRRGFYEVHPWSTPSTEMCLCLTFLFAFSPAHMLTCTHMAMPLASTSPLHTHKAPLFPRGPCSPVPRYSRGAGARLQSP